VSPGRKGFTHRGPQATLVPGLVERDFTAPGPNRLRVTGLTTVPTNEGPLRLSAIRNTFSRRAVARKTSARVDSDPVPATPEYALTSRKAEPGKLVHHATTTVGIRPSSSQPACYAWEFRHPWGRSGARSTVRTGPPPRQEPDPCSRLALRVSWLSIRRSLPRRAAAPASAAP